MTRAERREYQREWTRRRVRGVLDGLSLALSDLGELQADVTRVATKGTPAEQNSYASRLATIEGFMAELGVLRDQIRHLSPLPLDEEG